MKRLAAFKKDCRRARKKSMPRFLSILAIVALGAGFYAGICAVAPDMRLTADKYYDDTGMMDIELLSTLGFTDEDIEAIRGTDGVEHVMAGYAADALSTLNGDSESVVRIHSLPDDASDGNGDWLNRPVLVEGRMPEADDECLLGVRGLLGDSANIGATIKLVDSEGDLSDTLNCTEFKIVGVVKSSYYISYSLGSSSIGNGSVSRYIFVPQSAFCVEAYTDVYASVKDAAALECFTDGYKDTVNACKDALETLSDSRERIRYNEIHDEAQQKIDDAQSELDDARAKANAELKKAYNELMDGETALEDARNELTAQQNTLADSRRELNEQSAQLDALEPQYTAAQQACDALQAQIAALDPTAADYEEQYASLSAQYASCYQTAETLRLTLENGRAQIAAGTAQLDAADADIASGLGQINEKRAELDDGWDEYNKSKTKAESKIADAQDKITEAKQKLSEVERPEWYVLTRESNVGYVSFGSDADRMQQLSTVFPVLFFLVAALVSLTTMTRMVEEERVLIGTYKALGYSDGQIISRYMRYAFTATLIGAIIGIIAGFIALPLVVWNAYRILYTAPDLVFKYHLSYAFGGLAFSLICTLGATWFACRETLREYPASLMLPKAPKPGKRILLERVGFIWKHMSFTGKVTARNLFRYKKRLLMTMIGIAGCTGLIVAGFGVKDSVSAILHNQYGELYKYNTVVTAEESELSERASALLDEDFGSYMRVYSKMTDMEANGETQQVYLYVPDDSAKLDDYISLRERSGKIPIAFSSDSAVLTEKAARLMDVSVGDTVSFEISDGKTVEVKITGIAENYIYHYLYLSPELYAQLSDETPDFNMVVASYTDTDAAARAEISESLRELPEFSTVVFTDETSASFDDMITALNYVVLVMIFCANALAFVVLYNLTNININERMRELATIKVLGFRNREVANYIFREINLLTLMGGVLGLGLGKIMHTFVIKTVEVDIVMFGRNIEPRSYLYSFLLTLVFSLIVDIVMYPRLKKIDMVESLKSVD